MLELYPLPTPPLAAAFGGIDISGLWAEKTHRAG